MNNDNKQTIYEKVVQATKNNILTVLLIVCVVLISGVGSIIDTINKGIALYQTLTKPPSDQENADEFHEMHPATLSGTIAYIKEISGKGQIFTQRAFYGSKENLSRRFSNDENDYSAVRWSNSGKYLAACDFLNGLFIMDTSGTIKVHHKDTHCVNVAWSPDDKRLAYEFDGQIFVMKIDGSNLTKMTVSPTEWYSPIWISNTEIAFIRFTGGVWKADISDGKIFQLFHTGDSQGPLSEFNIDYCARDDVMSFSRYPNGNLYLYDFRSNEISLITRNKQGSQNSSETKAQPMTDEAPSTFSPDCKYIGVISKTKRDDKNKTQPSSEIIVRQVRSRDNMQSYDYPYFDRLPDTNGATGEAMSWYPK